MNYSTESTISRLAAAGGKAVPISVPSQEGAKPERRGASGPLLGIQSLNISHFTAHDQSPEVRRLYGPDIRQLEWDCSDLSQNHLSVVTRQVVRLFYTDDLLAEAEIGSHKRNEALQAREFDSRTESDPTRQLRMERCKRQRQAEDDTVDDSHHRSLTAAHGGPGCGADEEEDGECSPELELRADLLDFAWRRDEMQAFKCVKHLPGGAQIATALRSSPLVPIFDFEYIDEDSPKPEKLLLVKGGENIEVIEVMPQLSPYVIAAGTEKGHMTLLDTRLKSENDQGPSWGYAREQENFQHGLTSSGLTRMGRAPAASKCFTSLCALNAHHLVTGCVDGTLTLWDLRYGGSNGKLSASSSSSSFSPGATGFRSRQGSPWVASWSLEGDLFPTGKAPPSSHGGISHVAASRTTPGSVWFSCRSGLVAQLDTYPTKPLIDEPLPEEASGESRDKDQNKENQHGPKTQEEEPKKPDEPLTRGGLSYAVGGKPDVSPSSFLPAPKFGLIGNDAALIVPRVQAGLAGLSFLRCQAPQITSSSSAGSSPSPSSFALGSIALPGLSEADGIRYMDQLPGNHLAPLVVTEHRYSGKIFVGDSAGRLHVLQ